MEYVLDKSAWLYRKPQVENGDSLSALIYDREVHAFRHFFRFWLKPDEVETLMDEACAHFNAPRIPVRYEWGATIGGRFWGMKRIETWYIALRGRTGSRTHRWRFEGRDRKCRPFYIDMLLPAGHLRAHDFCHEFAHFLSVLWWNNHRHDALFTSVEEVVHDWYRSRRGKKYARGKDIHYVRA